MTSGGPAVSEPSSPISTDDPVVTVHEERLRVDTEVVMVGRVRLRTYLVTEEQTFTVPVTRQEIAVDYEEFADLPHPAMGVDGLSEDVYETVRYEERVVITKQIVPVERVRLVRTVVTDQRRVGGPLAREVVDVDLDD